MPPHVSLSSPRYHDFSSAPKINPKQHLQFPASSHNSYSRLVIPYHTLKALALKTKWPKKFSVPFYRSLHNKAQQPFLIWVGSISLTSFQSDTSGKRTLRAIPTVSAILECGYMKVHRGSESLWNFNASRANPIKKKRPREGNKMARIQISSLFYSLVLYFDASK